MFSSKTFSETLGTYTKLFFIYQIKEYITYKLETILCQP